MVNVEDRFKFVDDLTVLELINLLMTEISSYNIFEHVPSDIPVHNKYIKKENLVSQKNLSNQHVDQVKEDDSQPEEDQEHDFQFHQKLSVYYQNGGR